MKAYWRRPYQFFEEFKVAIENGRLKEPNWWKFVLSEPPGQHALVGRKPWKRLDFPLDAYRSLYYTDYSHEASLYAQSTIPGESKYYKSPMEVFFERFELLTEEGLSPDLAYLQCQEEKKTRDFCSELERYFCAQQAVHFYGLDPDYEDPKPRRPVQTPYEKARAAVFKEHSDRLQRIINMRIDMSKDFKISRQDLGDMDNEEILQYIRTHPEYAHHFDETVYFGDDLDLDPTQNSIQPSYEFLNDYQVKKYFGDETQVNTEKWRHKNASNITHQDLEDIQEDVRKLILGLSDEMGIDEDSDTLFDSLSEHGRFEVLLQWSAVMPDTEEIFETPMYRSKTSAQIQGYLNNVVIPGEKGQFDDEEMDDRCEDMDSRFDKFRKKWLAESEPGKRIDI